MRMSACRESKDVSNCSGKTEKQNNDQKTVYKWFLIISLVMVTISCAATISATLSVGSHFNSRLNLQYQEISDLQREISQLKTQVESLGEYTESLNKEDLVLEKRQDAGLNNAGSGNSNCCCRLRDCPRLSRPRPTMSPRTLLRPVPSRFRLDRGSTIDNGSTNRVTGVRGGTSETGRKALVTFVRWGAKSCPGGDGSGEVVSGLLNGEIFALHSRNGNPVPGTDIICLSTPPSTSSRSSTEGLSLQPLQFRMDHLDSNRYRNPTGGRLHCSYCQHSGTHVEILLGRTRCPSSSWKLMYTGKYVTAAGTSGTSSGICVSDRIDQPTTFPHQSGNTIATTIRSSSPHFTSSNLQVPCVICVLNKRESSGSVFRTRAINNEVNSL